MEVDVLAEKQYMTGLLNQDVPIGKGTMIEYVVLTALNDCVKESFNFEYDLTSKRLGELNVKSSSKHVSKNGSEWYFGKHPGSYIPDYYVCVGLDEEFKEIAHVWIIPGDARVIGSYGIHVIDNAKGLRKVSKYETDPDPYNKRYKSIDFTTFPEFQNTNNDSLKLNRSIAKDIKEGFSVQDIEREYGEGYYLKYLKWINENDLKKCFNLKNGVIGVFSGRMFLEITDDTYPTFDYMGKYIGYMDNGRNCPIANSTFTIGGLPSKMKSIQETIRLFTKTEGGISLEDLKQETGIGDVEKYVGGLMSHGIIMNNNKGGYKWV